MLEVDHVHKEFGSVRAVRDVHFTIPDGTTFGLLGPNGAGKTTTMRMILGILTPDGGAVRWNGQPVHANTRKHFGYLPEERGIYGKMKVRDQIAYFGKLHGMREPSLGQEVDRWIERLGITQYADRPCAELSKGNQQKVQVACAAVHRPQLLVLDEPFSGLDPVNADILLAILRELQSNGTALVLSSHQMWQLEDLCDRFCIIADGENRASGTLEELRSVFPTRVVRIGDTHGTSEINVPATTDFAAMLRELVSTKPITRFEAVEPSLHEIYLHAIGGSAA